MSNSTEVNRIFDPKAHRERHPDAEVWRVCKWCGDEIPASRPHHAYCDSQCKRSSMAEEMGFAPKESKA